MNFRRQQSSEMSFQIAPMIDVIFLLLCFFVTSQIFATYEQNIPFELPTAKTSELPKRLPGDIIVNIKPSGEVIVMQRSLSYDKLKGVLTSLAKEFAETNITIRADKTTPYEYVVAVLDLCREVGLYKVRFATSQSRE